jgi:hypothetical protein
MLLLNAALFGNQRPCIGLRLASALARLDARGLTRADRTDGDPGARP